MNKTEEAKLINSVEAGEWSSVADLTSMKERLMKAASETALKDYRINVRISKRDVVDAIYITLGNQRPDGVVEISEGVNLSLIHI